MKPYTPDNSKGRAVGGHDIHHRTADQPKSMASRSARAMRHAARQDARRFTDSAADLSYLESLETSEARATTGGGGSERVTFEMGPRAAALLRGMVEEGMIGAAWLCAPDSFADGFTVDDLRELESAVVRRPVHAAAGPRP